MLTTLLRLPLLLGFVVLIDQAMEVLVHFEALIVVLELLVWIVALLAAKEGSPGPFRSTHSRP
jgi:hypothetical protein